MGLLHQGEWDMEHFSFKVGTVAFCTVFFRDHGAVAVFPPESSACFPVLNAEVYLAHFGKMLWQNTLEGRGDLDLSQSTSRG